MKEYLYKFDRDIENIENMLAHIDKDDKRKKETLMEHSNLVFNKVIMFNEHNNFFTYVIKLIDDVIEEVDLYKDKKKVSNFLFKLFLNSIYMHDIGKSSVGFQCKVMNNEFFKKYETDDLNKNHSPYSSKMFLDYACEEFINKASSDLKAIKDGGNMFLLYIIFNFAYCIQKHHSSLVSIESFYDTMYSILSKPSENEDEEKEDLFKINTDSPELIFYKKKSNKAKLVLKLNINDVKLNKILDKVSRELFLLNKILYSTLVAADSIATSEYMNGSNFELNKLDIESLMKKYRESNIYTNIQKHFESNIFEGTINSIRCDIFKETDNNISKNIDKNIFYLEAPTGSGKTNTSMNVAFRAVELSKNTAKPLDRIIYTAPFNSITTQTSDFLNKIFENSNIVDIAEINSAAEIKVKENNKEEDYDLSLLDYQMLNYPITLTSYVKLFSILFGNNRKESLSLIHLFNSVVIIDEIQAYKIDVWYKMISLLDVYAKYMNIKFVIMSATLPKIGVLLDKDRLKSSYCDLISDSSLYFDNKYFKNRISTFNFDMLSEDFKMLKEKTPKDEYKNILFKIILNRIRNIYKENKESKILIEFIKKKTCREFYKFIKEENEKSLIKDKMLVIKELTGEDNSYFKKETINLTKTLDSIILVSTQCVEAGVDINMDYGFKDISYIDNEEQFLGRIRREYDESKYSEVIFFDLDNEHSIYSRNSFNFKMGLSLLNPKYRKIIQTKKFSDMFDELLSYINKCLNSLNDKVSKNSFELNLRNLNYQNIYKDLELIENRKEYNIFIPFDIDVVEDNNKVTYKGRDVWMSFLMANGEEKYSKRKIEMFNQLTKMSLFTYKYFSKNIESNFEEFLKSKGIGFMCIKNIYYLSLDKKDIAKFIDEEYKFDKEKFEALKINNS